MTIAPGTASKQRILHGGWTVEESARLYGLPGWGGGYFAVNGAGHVVVRPDRTAGREIDLRELVEGLAERDFRTPVLLRFSDVLEDRMRGLRSAFDKAIEQEAYEGGYQCVYPVKVNQQRTVLEEIRDLGGGLGFGLEAGSKPELLAVLGMTSEHPEMPIVCNGFKDREFIEAVILATKLGRRIIPVVEKFTELHLLVEQAERYGVRPTIGVRAKLSAAGVGRWESSGGARSKFGLFVSEILDALDYLKAHGMADCLKMVHFHIGSQVCDIRNLKNAINELTHIYAGLRRLGAGVDTIDVGGGLGVDYDGSRSSYESSMNYTVEEYAADVVYRIKTVCDDAGVPHPTIISESGRALAAYSSVLVFDVMGTAAYDSPPPPDELEAAFAAEDEVPQPVVDLFATYENVSARNLTESLHDAVHARDEAMSLFSLGYVSLPMRAIAERLFWAIGRRLLEHAERAGEMPDELAGLPELLSDQYFCNFSLFQSMPDSWAIDQIFPICPIQRLDEEPTRRAVLADITCDSDGKVDRFAGKRDIKRTLELHPVARGEKYYLAAFLVGAYQEILGDLHNLFGDTHAVHLHLDEDGEVVIDDLIPGDTAAEVLSYVQIDHKELRRAMRRDVERAVRAKKMSAAESAALMRFFEQGLDGYTYLED